MNLLWLAISVLTSSFVSTSCRTVCKTLIWGLLSFLIDSKSNDNPAFARFLEFANFVLPPVPSVFLMHLVRQHDLFVSFRQSFPPSHLTQAFLADTSLMDLIWSINLLLILVCSSTSPMNPGVGFWHTSSCTTLGSLHFPAVLFSWILSLFCFRKAPF